MKSNMKFGMIPFLLLIAITGCKVPTAGRGAIEGVVTDQSTGGAMFGVSVIYGDSAVYTDSDGHFLYENMPEGMQGIRFYKEGFYDTTAFLTVAAGTVTKQDMTMKLETTGWAAGKIDTYYGTILKSTDGGKSWLRQGVPSLIPEADLTSVCAVNSKICWIAGLSDDIHKRNTILYTSDGGATWTNQGSSLTTTRPIDLAGIVSRDGISGWAVASDTALIASTSNSGKSWKTAYSSTEMEYYTGITTPDGINIWCSGKSLSGGPAVEYSSDGGVTWSFIRIEGGFANQCATDICAISPSELFVTGDLSFGAFISTDGGKNWTPSSALGSKSSLGKVHAFENRSVWLAGAPGELFLSHDALATATNIFPAEADRDGTVSAISFMRDGKSGSISILSASGKTSKLFYSEDEGATWHQGSMPYTFSINDLDFVGGSN